MAVQLRPQTLIQRAIADAEKALNKANIGNAVLSQQDIERLPSALKGVVDDFRAAGNPRAKAADVIGMLRSSLEAGLKNSLKAGELLDAELTPDLGQLLAFSQMGLQVQQLVETRAAQAPVSFAAAAAQAQSSLANANLDVGSQIDALKSLQQAAKVAKIDAPDTAPLLDGVAKDRAKLLRGVADQTVKTAEKANDGSNIGQRNLAAALQAAVDVHKAVNPKSMRIKTLQKKQSALGVDAPKTGPAQPFFARFLEQQKTGTTAAPGGAEDIGAVTMKYPSDNEDGEGEVEGPGGVMTTMKYPSDGEDGGDAEYTTLKYPSDNEDGGGSGPLGGPGSPGDNLTLKFPSDAEDGGDDGNIFVTMKFPSDNEDGGGGSELIPELRPELIVELRPELLPELRPEIVVEVRPELLPELRPELIPEIAPEIAPGTGTVRTAERRAVKAGWHGHPTIDNEIKEIDKLLRTALMSEEALSSFQLQRGGLVALSGGMPAINKRLKELERLVRAGLLSVPQQKRTQDEHALLSTMKGLVGQYEQRAESLTRRRHRTPAEDIESRVMLAAAGGKAGIEGAMRDLRTSLDAAPDTASQSPRLNIEYNALKALLHGGPQLQENIDRLTKLEISAGMTPELAANVSLEKSVLTAVLDQHKVFEKALRRIDGPGPLPPQPHPELLPELRPEVVVELRPELLPELRPELIVELRPELLPELRPEVVVELRPEIAPTTGAADKIERSVAKAAFNGYETVEARIGEIESLMMRAMMTPEASAAMTAEKNTLAALYDGRPGLVDRQREIRNLMMVARLSQPALEALQLELDVLGRTEVSLATFAVKAAQTNRRHSPADDIISKALTVALDGGQSVLDRIKEIKGFTPQSAMDKVAVETLQLFYKGGVEIERELNAMRAADPHQGSSPEVAQQRAMKRQVLEGMLDALSVFKDVMDGNGPTPLPEPVVELAPELLPELRPELIAEIAPDLIGRGNDDE